MSNHSYYPKQTKLNGRGFSFSIRQELFEEECYGGWDLVAEQENSKTLLTAPKQQTREKQPKSTAYNQEVDRAPAEKVREFLSFRVSTYYLLVKGERTGGTEL